MRPIPDCRGTTETAKLVIQYLVGRELRLKTRLKDAVLRVMKSKSSSRFQEGYLFQPKSIENKLLQISPIFEAFGNAKSKFIPFTMCCVCYRAIAKWIHCVGPVVQYIHTKYLMEIIALY